MNNLIGNTVSFICDPSTELGDRFIKKNNIDYDSFNYDDYCYFIGTVIDIDKNIDHLYIAAVKIELAVVKDQMYKVNLFDLVRINDIEAYIDEEELKGISHICVDALLPTIKIDAKN